MTGATPAVALSAGIGFVLGVAAGLYLWQAREEAARRAGLTPALRTASRRGRI